MKRLILILVVVATLTLVAVPVCASPPPPVQNPPWVAAFCRQLVDAATNSGALVTARVEAASADVYRVILEARIEAMAAESPEAVQAIVDRAMAEVSAIFDAALAECRAVMKSTQDELKAVVDAAMPSLNKLSGPVRGKAMSAVEGVRQMMKEQSWNMYLDLCKLVRRSVSSLESIITSGGK